MISGRLLGVGLVAAAALACQQRESVPRQHLLARLRDARPAPRIVALRELAPDANHEETAAIARAASDGNEDVRVAVAESLGRAPDPSAIDELGFLLRDRSDAVRAAAVRGLLGKKGDRALDYVAHAYETGGALTRVAVSEAPAATFRRAVASEAASWRKRMEAQRNDKSETIRATALSENGRDATLPLISELSSRLVDPDPAMAAAAAAGLAHAHATDQIPALVGALHYPSDLVVEAAGIAIDELNPTAAASALAAALPKAGSEVAATLLDALDDAQLMDPARVALCRTAATAADPGVAVRAAKLAGPACALPSALPESGPALQARLLALAVLGHPDEGAHRRALALLDDPDAGLATAAAIYLGRLGEKSGGDAAALAAQAQAELVALREARVKRSEADSPPPPQPTPAAQGGMMDIFARLGRARQGADGNKPPASPKLNLLQQLLAQRVKSDRLVPFESRPGEFALLRALSMAAVRLGADGTDLAGAFLADDEPAVRVFAADVADLMEARGEPLREKIRADGDPRLKLQMAVLDWEAGRAGALDRLAALVPEVDVDGRMQIASVVTPHAVEAKAILLSLLTGDDAAAPLAARALATVPGDDVDQALIARLAERPDLVGYPAILALRNRPGPAIDAALTEAAVLPSPDLRGAAVEALALRKDCGAVGRLAPLEMDYDGYVRAQIGALKKVCGS